MMRPAQHLKTLPWLLIAALALAWAVVSVGLDPYGEFERFGGKRYFENHQTSPYRLAEQLRSGSHALVFGTSYSATLSGEELGEPALNLSTSVYGYPACMECFVQGLDEEQWKGVSRVYLLADSHLIAAPPDEPCPRAWSSAPAFYWATFRSIDQTKILRGLDRWAKNAKGTPANWVTPQGVTVYGTEAAWDGSGYATEYTDNANALLYLEIAAELVRAHGKEFVPFFTLRSEAFWRATDPGVLRKQLHMAVHAVGPIVMLGWHKDYSRRRAWFRDAAHHGLEGTRWEASVLKDAAKRKAWLLDEKGVDAWVDRLVKDLKTK